MPRVSALIRQATREDWWHVLEALKVLNVHGVEHFTKKRVKELVKKHCVGLISDGVDVAGACVLEVEDKAIEIYALGIAPHYQGMGLGSKFIRWSEAMARGVEVPFLYANSYEFYGALPFYEKNGFTTISKVTDSELPSSFYTFVKMI